MAETGGGNEEVLLNDLKSRIAKRQAQRLGEQKTVQERKDTSSNRTVAEPVKKSVSFTEGPAVQNEIKDLHEDADKRHKHAAEKSSEKDTSSSTLSSGKQKTKAKERYLKKKSQRRKQRIREEKVVKKREKKEHKDTDPQDAATEENHDDNNDRRKNDDDSTESSNSDERPADNDRSSQNSNKMNIGDSEGKEPMPETEGKKKRDSISNEEMPSSPKKRKIAQEPESSAGLLQPAINEHLGKEEKTANEPAKPPQDGSLERFPKIRKPEAPSQGVLTQLAISTDLPDSSAHVVDASSSTQLSTFKSVLSDATISKLSNAGITDFFAVQSVIVPRLLNKQGQRNARDLCVSAPTGSGKTLAYVVPIVEALKDRVVVRLRALIVVPTRDLVIQLRETIQWLIKGTDLKLGVAMGQHSLTKERASLTKEHVPDGQDEASKVDILIATPGRLIEHIKTTPNFSLKHLKYLVIDEADRLLQQSFQDWMTEVASSIANPPLNLSQQLHEAAQNNMSTGKQALDGSLNRNNDSISTNFFSTARLVDPWTNVQKLLFSATLTRDPSKLTPLRLHRPSFIAVQSNEVQTKSGVISEFLLPTSLHQHYITTSVSSKPLALLHLFHKLSVKSALTFTKSVESANRLAKLVELFEEEQNTSSPIKVNVFSSDMSYSQRNKILKSFRDGEFHVLICSDLISRGIDLPIVEHVISYDAPVDPRKYVHRAGRTARAGKPGDAWSLVELQEVSHFKEMLKQADLLQNLERTRLTKDDLEILEAPYENTLRRLKDHYNPVAGE